MESNNKVDILLATFNGAKYIREQIDSLLAQTYDNWKLLVRDDGSSDDTVSIIKEYEANFPERIALYEDELGNLGACQSFSILLGQSNSPYVMFCDQDDVWLESKIQLLLDKILSVESEVGAALPVLVHSDLIVVDEKLDLIAGSMWKHQGLNPSRMDKVENLLIQNHVTGCATLINRRLADISIPIPSGVIMHDWWLALVAVTCGKLIAIPEKTIMYRQHGSNSIGAKKWGISHIVKSIPMIPTMFGGFNITGVQASGLLSLEDKFVDEKAFAKVKRYVALFSKGWLLKKITVIRLGVYKYGFIRNLAMILFI